MVIDKVVLKFFISLFLCSLSLNVAVAQEQILINNIIVTGNQNVDKTAVLTLIETSKGELIDKNKISTDILKLYDLGYFEEISFYQRESVSGVDLVIHVKEKPSIIAITFSGLDEIQESSLTEKLETKLYTIINDATITNDLRMIEKQYFDKGFYLTSASYSLITKAKNQVELNFNVVESSELRIANINIVGNTYFTDSEIITGKGLPGLASRPITRTSFSRSLFREESLDRDVGYLSYIYRDQGFADVKVASPITTITNDRKYVDITFQVEEGIQYKVNSIDFSGDLLFTKKELFKGLKLKSGGLFRLSYLQYDINKLSAMYSDIGYAYVNINPKTKFDKDNKLVSLDYEITKGDKVYFGLMSIVGNVKTRDNVIRREFEITDGNLYSGTKLSNTSKNIKRLGFFEEVRVIKKRDEHQKNLLNLEVNVKEKPTGQLQGALGFSPGASGSKVFVTGSYSDKNQSGYAWSNGLSVKYNGQDSYSIRANFTNPRVNDSIWSAGTDAFYSIAKRKITEVDVDETRYGGSVFMGRKIIELIRGRITYRRTIIDRDTHNEFLLDKFIESGTQSSIIFSLIRNSVDNYISPTEGIEILLRQQFTGGKILRGDDEFMESSANITYYYPIDFTDTYRTYFRFNNHLSYIYPFSRSASSKHVPFIERYRLGGYNNLRGWDNEQISPRFRLLRSPNDKSGLLVSKGGDKKFYSQLEYYLPLIPEAGLKALVFADIGRVYDDTESLSFKGLNKDIGFGFRWITPVAPFRFEWAYPIEDGKLGDLNIVFYIGYD